MKRLEMLSVPLDFALWSTTSSNLSLSGKDVHLWYYRLDDYLSKNIDEYTRILSKDEKKRATKITSDNLRCRFITIRAELRILLAAYLEMQPEEPMFRYGSMGKPYLKNYRKDKALHFSVSHSGEFALYAMTKLGEVGVDIERISTRRNLDNVARKFFTTNENERLQRLSTKVRREAIYALWCQKEAYAKVIGCRVIDVLAQSNTSIASNPMLQLEIDEESSGQPYFHDVNTVPGYACSVAVLEPDARISCYQKRKAPPMCIAQ